MAEEPPTPWVHGSDEDIVSVIAFALRHEGKRAIRQADQLIAQAAAARVLETMKRTYVITPKAPRPLAQSHQLPRMGGDRDRSGTRDSRDSGDRRE